MTTVKEFKEWLNRFPDDATVEVIFDQCFYNIELLDSDLGNGWEYVDYTENEFVKKDHPYYNKKVLFLGEEH